MNRLVANKILLSGRFLVRLVNGEFNSFQLERQQPHQNEFIRLYNTQDFYEGTSLIVYASGRWISNGYRCYEFEYTFNSFINDYLAKLIQKVKDPDKRNQILKLFTNKNFCGLPVLILAIETLCSSAIKYPDQFPYLYKLFTTKRLHRYTQENSPYIFLSILYGNQELARAVSNSLTDTYSQYYFNRGDPNSTLEFLTFTYNNKDVKELIQQQVLSLKIPPYSSIEDTLPY